MTRWSRLLLAVLAVAACSSAGALPPAETAPEVPTTPPKSSDPSPTASPSPPQIVVRDGPPAAQLLAEGGDPVTGQLGTYTWGDGGSDSPWLPGAPIAVGAGEPLSMTFQPTIAVASWRARSLPSSADGPDGARLLAEGAGHPAFAAPAAGSWTVEVHVAFDGGEGDASYFWRLEVT
jgi:hypothetical protein